MARPAARCLTLLAVAFALLTPSPAGALPLNQLASRFTVWLSSLWGDAGCSMDPYGHCGGTNTPLPPAENLDNGCSMDPYGRCGGASAAPTAAENLDAGCHMDPYGACQPDR